jgi:hypothetical protein
LLDNTETIFADKRAFQNSVQWGLVMAVLRMDIRAMVEEHPYRLEMLTCMMQSVMGLNDPCLRVFTSAPRSTNSWTTLETIFGDVGVYKHMVQWGPALAVLRMDIRAMVEEHPHQLEMLTGRCQV